VELLLVPGHTLRLRRSAHLLGDRLTRELAPLLEWRTDLSRDISALARPRQAAWNAVLPYAALLDRSFGPIAPDADAGTQTRQLKAALASLAQDIRLAEMSLPRLSEGAPMLSPEEASRCLARLRPIAEASDLRSFLARAREQSGSPDALERDVRTLSTILSLRPRPQGASAVRGHPEGR
jgi:hypothetical protein